MKVENLTALASSKRSSWVNMILEGEYSPPPRDFTLLTLKSTAGVIILLVIFTLK